MGRRKPKSSCCKTCSIKAEVDGCNVTITWKSTGTSTEILEIGPVEHSGETTVPHTSNIYTLRVTYGDGEVEECTSQTFPGCFCLDGPEIVEVTGTYSEFEDVDQTKSMELFCLDPQGAGFDYTVNYIRTIISNASILNHSFDIPIVRFTFGDEGACEGFPFTIELGNITVTVEVSRTLHWKNDAEEIRTCTRVYKFYSSYDNIDFIASVPVPYLWYQGVSGDGDSLQTNCHPITTGCSNPGDQKPYAVFKDACGRPHSLFGGKDPGYIFFQGVQDFGRFDWSNIEQCQ